MNKINTKDLYKLYRKNSDGVLSYNEYKSIIAAFHKKISELIIQGALWEMPYFLGLQKVVLKKRKFTIKENGMVKGQINWGESNKRKANLIENQELPLAYYKDEEGNIIGDNGGKEWLVYHITPFYPLWIRVNNPFLKNSYKCKFSPTRHNEKTLAANIDENAEFIYHEAINNETHKNYFL